jgi:hypothetical protein
MDNLFGHGQWTILPWVDKSILHEFRQRTRDIGQRTFRHDDYEENEKLSSIMKWVEFLL